jgi:cytoskeletal protein CcmA (bactofilin family)
VLGMRPKDSDETDAAPTTDRRQVSVIGKGMKVVGDCECEGDLRVDGTVTGNVRAPRLHIAESGSVAGDVSPLKDAAGEGVFSIAGRVGGAVRAAEVEVRKGGFVVGTVMADRAVVHGHVGGGIVVKDRLALEATAEVEGDIQARRLAIKEGGQFDGKIRMTETPPRERAAPVVAAAATPLSAP